MFNIRHTALALTAVLSQMAVAAPVSFSGSLADSDPTYRRVIPTLLGILPPLLLSPIGSHVAYDVFGFSVSANGTYSMETTSANFATGPSDDTFITLYKNHFNPAAPLLNAVEADDDDGAGRLSFINRSLTAGTAYFLVVTSFANGQYGQYNGQISGPVNGNGRVLMDPNAVPTPSTLALVPLALAAMALARRRRWAGGPLSPHV